MNRFEPWSEERTVEIVVMCAGVCRVGCYREQGKEDPSKTPVPHRETQADRHRQGSRRT